jgi:hypothetical protein
MPTRFFTTYQNGTGDIIKPLAVEPSNSKNFLWNGGGGSILICPVSYSEDIT